MTATLKALSRQDDLQNSVDGIRRDFQRKLEADTRIAMNKERERVLDFVSTMNPRSNHEMSLKLRHPSTGLWLTEGDEFKTWLNEENSKLWLYGIPGAGKTILASSVIEESIRKAGSEDAVAYFYCDYKNPETQDPVKILGSLARQIARQDEQSFDKLRPFYELHNCEERRSLIPTAEALHDLLVQMCVSFENIMILIDALDECGDSVNEVTELLASLQALSVNVKTLFLSRDEHDIRTRLSGYPSLSIAAKSSDLRLYVGAEIESRINKGKLRIKNLSLKDEIMERLVEGADGM